MREVYEEGRLSTEKAHLPKVTASIFKASLRYSVIH